MFTLPMTPKGRGDEMLNVSFPNFICPANESKETSAEGTERKFAGHFNRKEEDNQGLLTPT